MEDFAGVWGHTGPQLTTDAGTCKVIKPGLIADPFGGYSMAGHLRKTRSRGSSEHPHHLTQVKGRAC